VISNIERVANLFLTRRYAFLLAILVGSSPAPSLRSPHLTLVGSLTIGVPAFFLALRPRLPAARVRAPGGELRLPVARWRVATYGAYELPSTRPFPSSSPHAATLVLLSIASLP